MTDEANGSGDGNEWVAGGGDKARGNVTETGFGVGGAVLLSGRGTEAVIALATTLVVIVVCSPGGSGSGDCVGGPDIIIEDDGDGTDIDSGSDEDDGGAGNGLSTTAVLTSRDEGGGADDDEDAISCCLRVWFSALIAASRWPMAITCVKFCKHISTS